LRFSQREKVTGTRHHATYKVGGEHYRRSQGKNPLKLHYEKKKQGRRRIGGRRLKYMGVEAQGA